MDRIPLKGHWFARAFLFLLLLSTLVACGGEPIEPGATTGQEMTIIIRMIDAQDKWFRSVLIPGLCTIFRLMSKALR